MSFPNTNSQIVKSSALYKDDPFRKKNTKGFIHLLLEPFVFDGELSQLAPYVSPPPDFNANVNHANFTYVSLHSGLLEDGRNWEKALTGVLPDLSTLPDFEIDLATLKVIPTLYGQNTYRLYGQNTYRYRVEGLLEREASQQLNDMSELLSDLPSHSFSKRYPPKPHVTINIASLDRTRLLNSPWFISVDLILNNVKSLTKYDTRMLKPLQYSYGYKVDT